MSNLYEACLCVSQISIPNLGNKKLKKKKHLVKFLPWVLNSYNRNPVILTFLQPTSVPGTWNEQNTVLVNEHMNKVHRKSALL